MYSFIFFDSERLINSLSTFVFAIFFHSSLSQCALRIKIWHDPYFGIESSLTRLVEQGIAVLVSIPSTKQLKSPQPSFSSSCFHRPRQKFVSPIPMSGNLNRGTRSEWTARRVRPFRVRSRNALVSGEMPGIIQSGPFYDPCKLSCG